MRATILFAIFIFIIFITFMIFSVQYEMLLDISTEEAEKIIVDSKNYDRITDVYYNLRNIFGLLFAITFIGGIVAYLIDPHEKEGERIPSYQIRR